MDKEGILKFIQQRFAHVRAEHKKTMEQERDRAAIIKRLIPAIEDLKDKFGIDIGYRWGGLVLDSEQPPKNDYEKSWEMTEKIYDAFLLTELDVQVKKSFNGFRGDYPSWDWHIYVRKVPDDKFYLSMIVFYAEPDSDCLPVKQANISSYWTCQKK